MFFGSKVFYTAFTIFGIASSAFATPVVGINELEIRQTNVLSTVQALQSTVSPIITQLSKSLTVDSSGPL